MASWFRTYSRLEANTSDLKNSTRNFQSNERVKVMKRFLNCGWQFDSAHPAKTAGIEDQNFLNYIKCPAKWLSCYGTCFYSIDKKILIKQRYFYYGILTLECTFISKKRLYLQVQIFVKQIWFCPTFRYNLVS